MNKLVLITTLFVAVVSCKKDENVENKGSSSTSTSISGDWTWYETVQEVRNSNDEVQMSTPMSYSFQFYVHRFSGGIVSLGFSGVFTESGSYTNQTITFGTGGSNSSVYSVLSLSSNELVMEKAMSSDPSNDSYSYEITTLHK